MHGRILNEHTPVGKSTKFSKSSIISLLQRRNLAGFRKVVEFERNDRSSPALIAEGRPGLTLPSCCVIALPEDGRPPVARGAAQTSGNDLIGVMSGAAVPSLWNGTGAWCCTA